MEPSSSPEPAIDILARAVSRKSADQEIEETEEEDCNSKMSVALLKVTLSLAGPFEVLSSEPTSLGDQRESVPMQPPVTISHDVSLAATATVVGIQPTHPETKFSVAVTKTVFEKHPLVPAEAEDQPNTAESSGLTPLFTVVIISARILCALLRSIVR